MIEKSIFKLFEVLDEIEGICENELINININNINNINKDYLINLCSELGLNIEYFIRRL